MPFIKSNINKFKVESEKNTLTLMGKVLMFLIKKRNTSFQNTKYDRKRARIDLLGTYTHILCSLVHHATFFTEEG